jgi:hypothetical protein
LTGNGGDECGRGKRLLCVNKVLVLCGDYIIDWKDVAATCHWIKVFTADLDSKTWKYGASDRSGLYNGENLEYFRQTLKKKGGLDFETMVISPSADGCGLAWCP